MKAELGSLKEEEGQVELEVDAMQDDSFMDLVSRLAMDFFAEGKCGPFYLAELQENTLSSDDSVEARFIERLLSLLSSKNN